MRQKNEKLKVYEFLYNRLPFSNTEQEEYNAMQRAEALEAEFEKYLSGIDTSNISVHWHCEVILDKAHEFVNVLLVTDYCYYLFVLHDLKGIHYINPFNILCNEEHEAVLDLNRSRNLYETFKHELIDEGKFQRPIIIKYVMMNAEFKTKTRKSELFLSKENLPYYLRAIEHSAVIRKKYRPNVLPT